MCNLFENTSASEWLLYISEWEYKGVALSNIRVTTKVIYTARFLYCKFKIILFIYFKYRTFALSLPHFHSTDV